VFLTSVLLILEIESISLQNLEWSSPNVNKREMRQINRNLEELLANQGYSRETALTWTGLGYVAHSSSVLSSDSNATRLILGPILTRRNNLRREDRCI
jgi:hypothetical protein